MTASEYTVWKRELNVPNTTILKRGWPDFLVSRPSEAFCIEVKSPGDKVTFDQACMHEALTKVGLKVVVEMVPFPDAPKQESIYMEENNDSLWRELMDLEKRAMVLRKLLGANLKALGSPLADKFLAG